jgi:hypothetical protein
MFSELLFSSLVLIASPGESYLDNSWSISDLEATELVASAKPSTHPMSPLPPPGQEHVSCVPDIYCQVRCGSLVCRSSDAKRCKEAMGDAVEHGLSPGDCFYINDLFCSTVSGVKLLCTYSSSPPREIYSPGAEPRN